MMMMGGKGRERGREGESETRLNLEKQHPPANQATFQITRHPRSRWSLTRRQDYRKGFRKQLQTFQKTFPCLDWLEELLLLLQNHSPVWINPLPQIIHSIYIQININRIEIDRVMVYQVSALTVEIGWEMQAIEMVVLVLGSTRPIESNPQ